MMNEARIMVGIGAAALGYTGYLQSLEYARTRVQGRSLDARKGADTAQVPIVRHPDVRRMLLAQKSYVEGGLALALYAARLVDEMPPPTTMLFVTMHTSCWRCSHQLSRAGPRNGAWRQTIWPSRYTAATAIPVISTSSSSTATTVSISIHEGTHGIQALDLLGRKVTMQNGAGLRAAAGDHRADGNPRRSYRRYRPVAVVRGVATFECPNRGSHLATLG